MIQAFFSTIRRYRLGYARFAALYLLLAVAAAVSNVLSVRATGDMAQSAELGLNSEMMGYLAVLAAAGAVSAVAEGASALLRRRFYGKATHAMRGGFAARLLDMPYKAFAGKNSGEGVSLFTNDLPSAGEFATGQVLSQISQLVTLVVSVVFMAAINWWLTLLFIASFPLLALLQAKLAGPIGKRHMEASERRAELNAVVSDSLQNPLTIKAYGLERVVEQRFEQSYAKVYRATYAAAKTHAVLAIAGILASILPMILLYVLAALMVIRGSMTVAGFIALTIMSGPVSEWLMMFAQELARIQRNGASAQRLLEFLPEASEEARDGVAVRTGDEAVRFDRVTFGYGEDAKVFDQTSFSIEKGAITAIAGESGGGKSTALKLMMGLYRPEDGSVTLSSPSVTYVPQDCYLLPVSIRENILGGLPLEEGRLRSACENAGIYDFIQGLPEGFDAVLAESAANISGGQKQRIAMARAFYRDADILLLDEATSALDPVTEAGVLEAFRRYVKDNGKTAVAVAHRQTVLEVSDRVITLSKGGVLA